MKKIYRLRKSATNPFTKITGIKAIQITGGSNCLISIQKTVTSLPRMVDRPISIKRTAAFFYLTSPEILKSFGFELKVKPYNIYNFTQDDILKVTQTCGVLECVHPDHLTIKIKPTNIWWK